jgi:hypothetical protein
MGNEYTKKQIRTWLENAIKKAQNPDPAEKVKRERRQRAKKVAIRFGL